MSENYTTAVILDAITPGVATNEVQQQAVPMPWENPNPLFDVEQFAHYINQKPDFVRQLIKERRIAKVKIGRKVMLEKSEADQLIADGRRPATRPLNPDRFGH